jgi:hypothetical protein
MLLLFRFTQRVIKRFLELQLPQKDAEFRIVCRRDDVSLRSARNSFLATPPRDHRIVLQRDDLRVSVSGFTPDVS